MGQLSNDFVKYVVDGIVTLCMDGISRNPELCKKVLEACIFTLTVLKLIVVYENNICLVKALFLHVA